MNEEWRNELITKGAAFDALTEVESHYEFEDGHDHLLRWAKTKIFALPPVQPEKRTEERTETHARDLIDRQAAIDALCKAGCDSGYCGVSCDDVKAIENLPSAQPECTQGCKPMYADVSDTISRQAAVDAARDWYEGLICGSFNGLEKRLRALPSAQPKSTMGQVTDAVQSTKDCISRQAAIEAAAIPSEWDGMYIQDLNGRIREAIEQLPSAQKERMRGRWVPVTNGRGGYECDQCHNYAPSYQDGVEWLSDFCPNCGADMRGNTDEV